MVKLAESPQEVKLYLCGIPQNEFSLSNREFTWISQTASTGRTGTPRTDAVFVSVRGKTGKWASSPNEVVNFLKQDFGLDPSIH